MTHQENFEAVTRACLRATGHDSDDVFYDPGIGDVLLALGERANRFLDYRHFVASLKRENGTVTILDNSDSGGRLSDATEVCEWNLRLPLSGQSEETVAYLATLVSGANGTE